MSKVQNLIKKLDFSKLDSPQGPERKKLVTFNNNTPKGPNSQRNNISTSSRSPNVNANNRTKLVGTSFEENDKELYEKFFSQDYPLGLSSSLTPANGTSPDGSPSNPSNLHKLLTAHKKPLAKDVPTFTPRVHFKPPQTMLVHTVSPPLSPIRSLADQLIDEDNMGQTPPLVQVNRMVDNESDTVQLTSRDRSFSYNLPSNSVPQSDNYRYANRHSMITLASPFESLRGISSSNSTASPRIENDMELLESYRTKARLYLKTHKNTAAFNPFYEAGDSRQPEATTPYKDLTIKRQLFNTKNEDDFTLWKKKMAEKVEVKELTPKKKSRRNTTKK